MSHVLWSVGSSEAQLLIQQERLKDSIWWEAKDGDEGIGDKEGENTNTDDWSDWGGDLEIVSVDKEDIGSKGINTGDSKNTKEVENRSNSVGPSKSSSIGKDKSECTPGCWAEALVGEGSLDVGILWDILDTFLKDVKAVSSHANQCLYTFVFASALCQGSSVPLK